MIVSFEASGDIPGHWVWNHTFDIVVSGRDLKRLRLFHAQLEWRIDRMHQAVLLAPVRPEMSRHPQSLMSRRLEHHIVKPIVSKVSTSTKAIHFPFPFRFATNYLTLLLKPKGTPLIHPPSLLPACADFTNHDTPPPKGSEPECMADHRCTTCFQAQ